MLLIGSHKAHTQSNHILFLCSALHVILCSFLYFYQQLIVLMTIFLILQELISLFDRLDADNDKLVSFSEFSEGLFQHGISNLAALKANYKPHLPPRTDSEDHVPLSTVALGYGLFTEIDPDNTG